MGASGDDVVFVRWPTMADLRNQCKQEGRPCILVVEGGAKAPVCTDPLEDWVRSPISRDDLTARVKALKNRLANRRVPRIDSAGMLCLGAEFITISTTQAGLMELLIEHFGEVVYRDELEQRLAELVPMPTRNSLDLHIMRLRRRLSALELVIQTAWGRGYVLLPRYELLCLCTFYEHCDLIL